jgi:hypothetical protein
MGTAVSQGWVEVKKPDRDLVVRGVLVPCSVEVLQSIAIEVLGPPVVSEVYRGGAYDFG